ncbi:hypothetical protein [Aeromicrobium sp.]|uniref:hypothetical protein n=1 Tax=Aeromicrobium sp. TaxID=1871063 RepID=UPI003D6B550C
MTVAICVAGTTRRTGRAVRLPGYTLTTEAVFGLPNERLTIRHDSGTSATPYVGGTLLAARAVTGPRGLMRGLDTRLLG